MITMPAQAATTATVPTKFRHTWTQRLKSVSDPRYSKLTKHSIDAGSKGFHHKIAGKDLSVKKASGGWYRIGFAGNANPYDKTAKRQIGGKKVTVLMKKASAKSLQTDIFLTGKRTMTYNESFVNLK
ncbi:hypothetical protein [Lactiplantibacillus daowaiensis]|uniref:Extracellular protein n=1 Tax=Lactiplantibacillus daowaiensis TaxID=2559918 RepID=A0ABW1S3B8_9LACO|nr:hypothetical protein [Lactiplantibacillus daowaiensis]